ncbi:MAG TPA: type II toxin-antitoxin system HicB family antitoxin [Candidatus Portnoybacteria bacterium]|nr:type II toxin-antitoxin system HicB family antitoxin [Candidatus Portnoybacteria bacterium]
MLTKYISQKMNQARYKILEDGTYFGEIPGLQGVWASEKTLEKCRETLHEVFEEWLILKLQDGDAIPGFPQVKIKQKVYA